MVDNELDVRQLRKPEKHPAIFAAYADLPVGGSFVLATTMTPSTSMRNSRPITPAATAGSTSRRAPPFGGSGSANSPPPRCRGL